MMFSDEEIKEGSHMRPGDEIISIHEVCLVDKYDKKDPVFNGGPLLSNTSRNELEVPRYLRDGFYSEGLEQQARFAWTEEDGNIASLVSEPGFGTTGQTTFGKDLDAALSRNLKEADTSSLAVQTNSNGLTFVWKPFVDSQTVTSTSTSNPSPSTSLDRPKGRGACKVDKTDPRSRYHYVKYVKRHGRTIKLWECGICGREFQHQYTLMRHLPTHTDERNFHCDACAKSFRQLSTLSQHRAIHSTERPYACEVCSKTFNRVSTLISHRKTHSDEKPYKCHICPKGFHQKGNLRNHLFTHTNERPYRCNICMKGFNQQSNLVCHKNKAHPDENSSSTVPQPSSNVGGRSTPRPTARAVTDTVPDARSLSETCEVTSTSSSVGHYTSSPIEPTSSWPKPLPWMMPKSEPSDIWNENPWGSNGVIVDPIKTYHMEVALATKQTPFALLQSDSGTPVLVKVVDTKLPGGKQMLVPATAEDLRIGGKLILNSEENSSKSQVTDVEPAPEMSAVQIRVPVVATVVPRIRPGGRLQLAVEEPHHAYHTALSSDVHETKAGSCASVVSSAPRLESTRRQETSVFGDSLKSELSPRSPPAPSPPIDFSSLDLFEPIGCIPLGPQITTVIDTMDHPPPSDDSDIFIGKFEESIPLSDSD